MSTANWSKVGMTLFIILVASPSSLPGQSMAGEAPIPLNHPLSEFRSFHQSGLLSNEARAILDGHRYAVEESMLVTEDGDLAEQTGIRFLYRRYLSSGERQARLIEKGRSELV